MLTKSDLTQISSIVNSAIDNRVPKIIDDRVPKIVDSRVTVIIDIKLRPIKAALRKINKNIKTVVNYFDREYLDQSKRITRIEKHLGLQSN